MTPGPNEPQTGRETRLLVLVVGVAVIVLLLLAQWQFPASSLSGVASGGAPLAGLAARATFDEMASTMADVVGRVSPMTVVVPLERVGEADGEADDGDGDEAGPTRAAEPDSDPDAGDADEAVAAVARPPDALALGLRVRRDLVLLHVPSGFAVQSTDAAPVETVAFDVDRQITFVRVTASNAEPDTLASSIRTFPNFSYVAVIGATPVGPTVQPAFAGRADTVTDTRWSHALVPASAVPGLSAGAFVFSLDSRLIGLAVDGDTGPMIVPAPALETLVQALVAPPGAAPPGAAP